VIFKTRKAQEKLLAEHTTTREICFQKNFQKAVRKINNIYDSGQQHIINYI